MLPVPDEHDIDDPLNPYYEVDVIERAVKYQSDKYVLDVTKQVRFYVFPADIAQEQGHSQILIFLSRRYLHRTRVGSKS